MFYSELCNLFFPSLDVHLPTNPRLQKFHRKNRSAWLETEISITQSSPCDTLRFFCFLSNSGPLRAHGKAPLWHISTRLVSEHRSVYKTVYQVVCINCTWVAFKTGADDFTLPFSSTLFSLEMTVGTCVTEVSESLCPDRGVGVSSSSFLL